MGLHPAVVACPARSGLPLGLPHVRVPDGDDSPDLLAGSAAADPLRARDERALDSPQMGLRRGGTAPRHPTLAWEVVMEHARAAGGVRILLLGLAVAQQLLGAVLPQEVVHRIQADPVVQALTAQVRAQLCASLHGLPCTMDRHIFYLRTRERVQDRLRYFLWGISGNVVPRSSRCRTCSPPQPRTRPGCRCRLAGPSSPMGSDQCGWWWRMDGIS